MLEQKSEAWYFPGDELTRATKKVVKVALERVSSGYIDNYGAQDIHLKADDIVFRLKNERVKRPGLLRVFGLEPVLSLGGLESGLFIFGMKVNKNGYPMREPAYTLLLPRDPELVSSVSDTDSIWREYTSEQMKELAEKLKAAKWMSEKDYRKIYKQFTALFSNRPLI